MKMIYPKYANNLKNTILNYILHKCNLIKEKFDNNKLNISDSSKFTFYFNKYKFYPLFEVVICVKYDKDYDMYDVDIYTYIYTYKYAKSEYLYGYTLKLEKNANKRRVNDLGIAIVYDYK